MDAIVIPFLVMPLKLSWCPPLDKDVAKVKEFIYQVMIPKVEAGEFEMITDYKTHLQRVTSGQWGCGYSLSGNF